MSRVKILIIEDESIVALDIAAKLEKQQYHVVGIADNGPEALQILAKETPDMVLMDITIKGDMDGIETAEAIQKIVDIPIIYITALSDLHTLERLKATSPYAYLLKPFRDLDLHMAIELAFRQSALASQNKSSVKNNVLYQLDDRFFIKVGNGKFEKIMFSDLLYLKAERSYCSIFTTQKHFTLSLSLNHLLEQISFAHLHRIHKSYAVNTQQINAFMDGCVVLADFQIPIGAAYRASFHSVFNMMR
ncbi:MAG: response regulator [Chitinophagaceae bacterium]|jgi:DNA-binding LytR/AlgR family response regulator